MTEKASFRNWSLEADDDNVVWLGFDKADSAANILSHETLDELDDIIKGLILEKPRGLVIFSAKKSGFIAGADVNEFTKIEDRGQALELIQRGQDIMDRIEALNFPTVAMIHGFALGGGLELALACRYRVASDDDRHAELGAGLWNGREEFFVLNPGGTIETKNVDRPGVASNVII